MRSCWRCSNRSGESTVTFFTALAAVGWTPIRSADKPEDNKEEGDGEPSCTEMSDDGQAADRHRLDTVQLCQSKTSPQVLVNKELATTVSIEAEGTGLEPATPYGAPVLQTGR